MRLGIYGGSFDPPHLGHLALAKAALAHLNLDEVTFVPASQNPRKLRRPVASDEQRLEMLSRLIEGEPRFSVADLELRRGGTSYTVETLETLSLVRPGRHWFLIGADALKNFTLWRRPERIAELCRIAAVSRDADDLERLLPKLPKWLVERVDPVPMPQVRAASSTMREFAALGEDVSRWTTPAVGELVREKGLYRETSNGIDEES